MDIIVRHPFYEYFDINDMPVGEIPYSAFSKALKDEIYFRRFDPTFYRNDLLHGHKSALLYWYPYYIDYLNDRLIKHDDDVCIIIPQLCNKLDRLKTTTFKLNHLDEIEL